MNLNDEIEELAEKFEQSQKIMTALGDESRQYLLLTMMKMGRCDGVRALEVVEQCNLSRPAVSHHLQILKDAGILKSRKEGTKIYYYFNRDMESFKDLIDTLQLAVNITRQISDPVEQESLPNQTAIHG